MMQELSKKFWGKVTIKGPDDCWPYRGRLRISGVFVFHREVTRSSARSAWWFARGPIYSKRLKVCHTCDNPGCCNPAHLWLGTQSANMRDCFAKGRHPPRRNRLPR